MQPVTKEEPKKPSSHKKVGVRNATKSRLGDICRVRGWSEAEAIDRMTAKELSQIELEKKYETTNHIASPNAIGQTLDIKA